MLPSPPLREPRKDALRNRAHILDVTREAFAAEGIDVSMDAIAKRAGVGPGTLYRHYPNKDALLTGLLALHHDALDQRRIEIETGHADAGHALDLWIDALGDWMLSYEGLPEPLREACRVQSALTPTCHGVIDVTASFLRAAQAAGVARATITGRDIFLAALAIAWASGVSAADGRTRTTLHDVLKNGWSFVDEKPDAA